MIYYLIGFVSVIIIVCVALLSGEKYLSDICSKCVSKSEIVIQKPKFLTLFCKVLNVWLIISMNGLHEDVLDPDQRLCRYVPYSRSYRSHRGTAAWTLPSITDFISRKCSCTCTTSCVSYLHRSTYALTGWSDIRGEKGWYVIVRAATVFAHLHWVSLGDVYWKVVLKPETVDRE